MKIQINLGREKVFVDWNEIVFIKADNIYCYVYLINNRVLHSNNTLGEFKIILPFLFMPHRSYLINLKFLKRFHCSECELEMDFYNISIPVSRIIKKELKRIIAKP